MLLQPGGQGLGLAVGQQIDPAPAFQITQDGAVAVAFAPRPVIDPEHDPEHAGFGRWLQADFTDAAQQCRAANRHAGAGRQTRSRIATQRQGDGMMRGAQAVGMAGSGTGHLRQTLAERAARAGVIDASKAPDVHEQDDRAPETRQIAQAAPIMTVHPPRLGPATRARCRCSRQPGAQGDAVVRRVDLIDDVKAIEKSTGVQRDQQAGYPELFRQP